ncbi:MAG: hypothetical protein IPN70_01645 [Candidatus Moraniibacteriota bacterium]|nr:MAG: hypothetical protein IPN70_01645 [Candidatus Moranbacteria bacterium]
MLSEKILSSSYSTSQANQLSQPPFDFIFSLKNTAELQKKKLVASIKTPNFPEKYRGKEFTVKFSILNENGNEILEPFHKTIELTKDSTLDQSIEIPLYARNGLHSIQAEVSFENYSVHKQKYFDMHITPAVIRLTP